MPVCHMPSLSKQAGSHYLQAYSIHGHTFATCPSSEDLLKIGLWNFTIPELRHVLVGLVWTQLPHASIKHTLLMLQCAQLLQQSTVVMHNVLHSRCIHAKFVLSYAAVLCCHVAVLRCNHFSILYHADSVLSICLSAHGAKRHRFIQTRMVEAQTCPHSQCRMHLRDSMHMEH